MGCHFLLQQTLYTFVTEHFEMTGTHKERKNVNYLQSYYLKAKTVNILTNMLQASFHVLINPFFGEMSIQINHPFLIQLLLFLLLKIKVLCIDISSLSDIRSANISCHPVGCLIAFLLVSFAA